MGLWQPQPSTASTDYHAVLLATPWHKYAYFGRNNAWTNPPDEKNIYSHGIQQTYFPQGHHYALMQGLWYIQETYHYLHECITHTGVLSYVFSAGRTLIL